MTADAPADFSHRFAAAFASGRVMDGRWLTRMIREANVDAQRAQQQYAERTRGGFPRAAAALVADIVVSNATSVSGWRSGMTLGYLWRVASAEHSPMAEVVDRNIRVLIEHRLDEERCRSTEERIADAITRFTGSMAFVYLHVVLFGLWIAVNTGWISVVPAFDASFGILTMVAAIEAIFLATFVLIRQNRMQALADKRAHLDLQVSLLAEHEITRLLTLVTAIARQMEIRESYDPELAELTKDVHPERVLDRIQESEEEVKG